MADPESSKNESRTTVKMKFVGHFRGVEKRVALPIPLISNSQKLDKELQFTRTSDRNGPAYCDVPMEWVGALLEVGGNWQIVDKLTADLQAKIDAAHAINQVRMQKFILENEMVEA